MNDENWKLAQAIVAKEQLAEKVNELGRDNIYGIYQSHEYNGTLFVILYYVPTHCYKGEIEIEKLACAVCKAIYNNDECGSCQHLLESKVIASKLIEAGYRKIPDCAAALNIGKNND